jgi:tetratricopeptide (TPR) repeat protein
VLDAASGAEVLILRGFAHLHPDANGFNPRVRFSPDGRRIAAICHDYANPVSIWSVEEAGADPAERQRAADHRARARHLEQAKSSLTSATQRAVFRFHLKWLGEAELTTATDLAARGGLYAQDGQWDRAAADFTRATQLAPDDEAIWYECGAGWAAAGRWEQALPYFARFTDLGRGSDGPWRSITALSLYRNDLETYRRCCQRMLKLHGRSADPFVVSRVLAWGPLVGDSGVGPEALRQQADRCLAGNEMHGDYRWLVRTKGMAEALIRKEQEDAEIAVNLFFLSMAYQRLNRPEEARARYQQGLRQMEKTFGGLDNFQAGKGDWMDWPWCQVVRREAEALLSGTGAGRKP